MSQTSDIFIPYWYALIVYWCKSLRRTGLTLPYLVGVSIEYDMIDERSPEKILEEMISYKGEHLIVVKYCSYIRENVFGIDSTIARFMKKSSNQYGNLLIPKGISKELFEMSDKDSLIQYLSTIYEIHIEKNEYSKFGDSVWGRFSTEDRYMIDSALNEYKH